MQSGEIVSNRDPTSGWSTWYMVHCDPDGTPKLRVVEPVSHRFGFEFTDDRVRYEPDKCKNLRRYISDQQAYTDAYPYFRAMFPKYYLSKEQQPMSEADEEFYAEQADAEIGIDDDSERFDNDSKDYPHIDLGALHPVDMPVGDTAEFGILLGDTLLQVSVTSLVTDPDRDVYNVVATFVRGERNLSSIAAIVLEEHSA
jgi:hypothetical protein